MQRKGAGWLIGAVIQTAFGGLIFLRGCVVMATDPPGNGAYAGGFMIGMLFGALVLFLGIRALRIYRRSRR